MNVDLTVLMEGGLEAEWGNGGTNLSLWWFLKITEEKEYTCMAKRFYQDQNILFSHISLC